MMENISKFKPNASFVEYAQHAIADIYDMIIRGNNFDHVIYLSCPMTGVDNYKERFNALENSINYIYDDYNIAIIKPNIYLDAIPKKLSNGYEPTYIDKVFFTYKLLALCDMIIVDDHDDAWMNSRGVLTELSYASFHEISIYGTSYLEHASNFKDYVNKI